MDRRTRPSGLSIAGIRVPDPGTELAPRAHYENAVAAFYAREGKTHFAELIEAGHGCAACHLTHGLNGIASNKELDLAQYAQVARHTKIARDVIEVYAFASITAGARVANMLDGPAKISVINAVDELDPILARRSRNRSRRIRWPPASRTCGSTRSSSSPGTT